MASLRSIMTLDTPYPEEGEEFLRYLSNNVDGLFSDVGSARYTVTHLQIRSTINEGRTNFQGAKHRKLWQDLAETIVYDNPNSDYNNMHKAQIHRMLHDDARGSYTRLTNLVKKYINYLYEEDIRFNVVKYVYLDNFNNTGGYVK